MTHNSLLTPLAALYGCITSARNFAFDCGIIPEYKASLPVISVGNLTTGGSGKSPFTQYIVEQLRTKQKNPVILMRGYGGSCQGPSLVQPSDTVEEVGDEALMHLRALTCPVVIARRRVNGAQFIEREKLGSCIILDDGFQHRRLYRNCDLLLIDVTTQENQQAWLAGELLPKGRFRESRYPALKRASAILLINRGTAVRSADQDIELLRKNGEFSAMTYEFRFSPHCFIDAYSGETFAPKSFDSRHGHVLTAIASAQSFCAMLAGLGIILESCHIFRDHHIFTRSDYLKVLEGNDLPIFTTAKDAIKLASFVKTPGKLFVLKLDSCFVSKAQEEKFWAMIERKCFACHSSQQLAPE